MSHITLVHSRDAQDKIILTKPLPPKWDGLPIEWLMPWSLDKVIVCAGAAKASRCWAEDDRGVRCDSRLFASIVGLVHGRRRLHLSRCLECGHDTVVDLRGWGVSFGEVWDLDETDYGPSGSWAA